MKSREGEDKQIVKQESWVIGASYEDATDILVQNGPKETMQW